MSGPRVRTLLTAGGVCVALATAGSASAWDGAPWADPTEFIRPIDATTKAHLQSVALAGAVAGRVEGRMGQIGDSITESSAYFRNAIMNGITSNETGHDYDPVRSWLAYSGAQPADANSFYRNSGKGSVWGNLGGWELADAVAAGHPATAIAGQGNVRGDFSWVLVMYGTNDIDEGGWSAGAWKEDLRDFVSAWQDSSILAVLSTIPPELAHAGDGRVEAANGAIRDLAEEEDLPLVDYYALILAHQPTTWLNTLISSDGTHPSAAAAGRGFSQAALTSTDGYALRTKLAFDVAEKLRAIVFDDGPPDADPTTAPAVRAGADPAVVAFPNPTRGPVTFAAPGASVSRTAVDGQFVVFDAAGRVVREAASGMRWDGRDGADRPASPGVYFVTFGTGVDRRVARVVVRR